ncbi:hypothetical protein Dsin_029896 [Dipteronia sinensis]|uniref:GST N-terminal domain-containing protein n=1 Tax=Dipteronia sinensis TaxID=43782 RepID=A0AAD9ZTE8_9ROSI|nr:hypothetical protein Dsin_029896 [Dipteronia sinensis]
MATKVIKLVGFWVSSFVFRVEWALKLKGVEFEYIEEDIFNKTNRLLELNPILKKVPAFVHDQKVIAESFVILEYIHRRDLGFSRGKVPFTYLGVPIFNGRPRKSHLQSLADKVRSKLEGWFGKLLSMAGHVQLVKSVVQFMLLHSFSVYKWPFSLICLLKKWTRNFIWTSSCNVKKLMTVSWDQVCCPKEEGGLGVRNFDDLNIVTLYKCAWNMISTDTPWSSHFKNRFTIYAYKLMEAAWTSIWSKGEQKERAEKETIEALEKIEEQLNGNKYFGGDDKIRYLDIAIG